MINLVSNAVKFTHEGEVVISSRLSDDEDMLCLSVSDTGIGIPRNMKEAVFEKFVQVDSSSTRRYGGSGLGLSISKRLAEMMDGRIDLETREGKGSVFTLCMPYRKADETSRALFDSKTEKAFGRGRTLVIAEDDASTQQLLSAILSRAGFKTLPAVNGSVAVSLCKEPQEPISAVIMDIQMPEMDGYEATRKVKAMNKDVAVIALTARTMEADREKSVEAGCDAYLAKPVRQVELLETLRKLIG
jgi:CheY-like chemotaxis protein/anti-sigma regulatory factor (Ser/Thr protein kinase)